MKKYLLVFFLCVSKMGFALDLVNTNKYFLNLNSNLLYIMTAKDKFSVSGIGNFDSTFEYINNKNTLGIYSAFEFNEYSQEQIGFIKELYIYNESDYGRIEIGKTKNISSKIQKTSPILFNDNISKLTSIILQNPYISFITEIATGDSFDDNVFKINYITPKFFGLQLGAFYVKDFKNEKLNNGAGLGLKHSYSGSFDLTTTISFAEFNDVDNYNIVADKVREYNVAAILYKQGLQFSTGLNFIGSKSEIVKRNYDVGISYEIGLMIFGVANYTSYFTKKYYTNLTMLSSKYKFNDIWDLSVGSGILYSKFDSKYSPLVAVSTGIKF